jgi:hypothetical protein
VFWKGLPPNAPVTIVVQAYRIAIEGQNFALVVRKM